MNNPQQFTKIFETVSNNLILKFFRSFRMRHLEIMKYTKPTDKILDCGCGTGYCLNYLKKKGIHDLYGIDIEDKFLEQCKNLTVYNLSITELSKKFQENSLDIIICYDLFHHLLSQEEYKQAIESIKYILKKNGYLFVADPTENFWWKIITRLPKYLVFIPLFKAMRDGHKLEQKEYDLYFANVDTFFNTLKEHFKVIKTKKVFFRTIAILQKV